jgi:hypothetical protein
MKMNTYAIKVVLFALVSLVFSCKTKSKNKAKESPKISSAYTIIQCGNNPFEVGENDEKTIQNFESYLKIICSGIALENIYIDKFADNVCLACHCPTGYKIHFTSNNEGLDCIKRKGFLID